jgi:hypothetical protein
VERKRHWKFRLLSGGQARVFVCAQLFSVLVNQQSKEKIPDRWVEDGLAFNFSKS